MHGHMDVKRARRLEMSVVEVEEFGDPCSHSHGPILYLKGSGRVLWYMIA